MQAVSETYVLDVHPFNPRIAMSAGYDGRTIVWDIWEGVPIRIYETGHFKLVDGKFSPDGTSIVLSDEVGQIYILATGQGESQKDAKYDQFFLGDYRPLIQDVHGNVLDQETQLPPYRRNIQDLLCDANMIPYPDPYQSMYQQRRLGALGIDWQPPPVRLAVGTIDDGIYAVQDLFGQFHPSQSEGDRDRWLEQPVELEDGMDWEQENDVQSDDTGSEYNVTDEYTSEGEQGSLNMSSPEETECSADEDENSKDEQNSRAHLRRSKRKKRKAEGVVSASCGRRVKKKHVDDDDEMPARIKRFKCPRNVKVLREKSLSEKSSRPQRLAARNALNLFSRIGESSTDESEELNGQDSESTGSQYSQSEANALSNESQRSSRSGKQNINDEEKSQNEVQQFKHGDSNKHTGAENNLSLKLPLRDSRKLVLPESTKSDSEIQGKTGSPSIEVNFEEDKQEISQLNSFHNVTEAKLFNKGCSDSTDMNRPENVRYEDYHNQENKRFERSGHSPEHHLNLSFGYERKEIKWGEVKARRSKRLRVGDVTASDMCIPAKTIAERCSVVQVNACQTLKPVAIKQNSLNGNGQILPGQRKEGKTVDANSQSGHEDCQGGMVYTQLQKACTASNSEELDIATNTGFVPETRKANALTEYEGLSPENLCGGKTSPYTTACNGSGMEANWRADEGCLSDKTEMSMPKDLTDNNYNGRPLMTETFTDDGEGRKLNPNSFEYHCEAAETKHIQFGMFRSRSRRTKKNSQKPSYGQKHATLLEDWENFGHELSFKGATPREKKLSGKLPWGGASTSSHCLQQREWNIESEHLEYNNDDNTQEIGLCVSARIDSEMDGKVKNAGHKKRPVGINMHVEGDNSAGMVQNSSNEDKQTSRFTVKLNPVSTDGGRRTRSKRIKGAASKTGQEVDSTSKNFRIDESYPCEGKWRWPYKHGSKARDLVDAEWRTASSAWGGIRLGRNRKGTGFNNMRIPVEKKKARQSVRKLSWLMLAEADEGNRYIPQFGDVVAYLRQGHQEFLEMGNSQERGPWKSLKGSIQSVEFCCVDGLEYSTLAGSGETCCKLTLKFIDQESKVYGRSFKLTLPELTHFPDFLVEKRRYEAAVKRNWTHRDKCQVWWRAENGEGGSWWEGRVIAVKPKSIEFPDSPWDRYVVQYKGDSSGPHTHSPWELFEPDNNRCESAHIGTQIETQLQRSIEELEQTSYENEDCYGLVKLSQVSGKSDFCNRIPLPLSLDIIKMRLKKGYYRTLKAFKHDFNVLVANAEHYFGKDIEMASKLRQLANVSQGLANES